MAKKKQGATTKQAPAAADVPAPNPAGHAFAQWLRIEQEAIRRHQLSLLTEREGGRAAVWPMLLQIVRDHYVSPEVCARRIEALGAPAVAALLRAHVPVRRTARSGDMGEILATECAERVLGYRIPIRKLRWRDDRNMALRGDDIVGIRNDRRGALEFLKGESKSRTALTEGVVVEAAEALNTNHGRPNRHSTLFVADRLREQGEDDLASRLEAAVLDSFRDSEIEHLVFCLSGNEADDILRDHLEGNRKRKRRHAVGVRIEDHQAFIRTVFEGL